MYQNSKESEGEGGSPFLALPSYRAVYATCETMLAFAREVWGQHRANDVNCFVLPSLGEQGNLINCAVGCQKRS